MDDQHRQKTKAELAEERFGQIAADVRKKVVRETAKLRRLIKNLQGDLVKHGDPEHWKRCGDLILANVHNAKRAGSRIIVKDYFSDDVPDVEIEGEANKPLNEIAENYFRLYTKARNGVSVIAERIAACETAIEKQTEVAARVEAAVEARDIAYLESLLEPPRKIVEKARKKKKDVEFNGARRFVSSDGFEILVGKKAKDNDFLTFRVARSLDTWLHAADFPGSHVVIHNPNRKEIPDRTLLEAAQIAAFYSDARKLSKAAVNYTLKKFVNKPKRSAPGLVSLASFRTILVEPKVPFDDGKI